MCVHVCGGGVYKDLKSLFKPNHVWANGEELTMAFSITGARWGG